MCVNQLTGCSRMLYKAFFILYIQYFSVQPTPTKNLFHVFLPYKENKLVKREKWRVTSGESYGCGSKEQLECGQCGSFSTQPFCSSSGEARGTRCFCSQNTAPVQIPGGRLQQQPHRELGWWFTSVLPVWPHVRSISATGTLPGCKLIIGSHSHNSSSKFHTCLVLIFCGVFADPSELSWHQECLAET